MIRPDRSRALRALYADWWDGIRTTDPDARQMDPLDLLAHRLTAEVPDLLDAIEQLQAEREEGGRPRVRTFCTPDSRGGNA